ncbi:MULTISPECIES: UDP-N-acetylmuramate dehydrogenase [unclassified Sedimentibacter]|uniref:UDP-N-acetylmuramate dehydrogenase n=1 Tax=unclassified Sedimentibacter TaxID=2649220 RepID=UPI0027DF08D5|nr:UDP-N-acetylmuramate dehydrogenase [Sedimentibacter sp. MB35-C1]WMJ77172.1 UDP-N-acetylmuramate dehydrogenase [Sedimentibacter sp. MB35-C1]
MKYQSKINRLYEDMTSVVRGSVLKDEPLKNHTYFKIGGPAAILAEPEDTEDLISVLKLVKKYETDCFVIGNGTNLLVADEGFKGVIIKIGDKFSYIERNGNIVIAGSGLLLSAMSKFIAREGLAGFEFASGIPGCLGGAVYMNAGAYGGEMKQVVKSVKCIDRDGNVHKFSNDDMEFTYRHSKITDSEYIVLEAEFEFKEGEREEILSLIRELNDRRISKQPLNLPSAGSTFKRPVNGYASKLIEDAGLKGLIHRGAMVSDKHCGFIVNIDNACCQDVLELMRIVISTVNDKFGITLEPEVKILGTSL